MKLKLRDVKSETIKDMEFGTCELCGYTDDWDEITFIFEDETGKVREVPAYEWDRGDCFEASPVENVFDFADWVSKQDFDNPSFTFYWLRDVIYDYKEHLERGGDEAEE